MIWSIKSEEDADSRITEEGNKLLLLSFAERRSLGCYQLSSLQDRVDR